MIHARLKYEMNLIYARINEMIPGYEANKSIRQEHIKETKLNKKTYSITIKMCTCLYKILYSEDHYLIEWYRIKDKELIKDGYVECSDLSSVVRSINDFIYSGFSPARGPWWMLNQKPKYNRRNKRWA